MIHASRYTKHKNFQNGFFPTYVHKLWSQYLGIASGTKREQA